MFVVDSWPPGVDFSERAPFICLTLIPSTVWTTLPYNNKLFIVLFVRCIEPNNDLDHLHTYLCIPKIFYRRAYI